MMGDLICDSKYTSMIYCNWVSISGPRLTSDLRWLYDIGEVGVLFASFPRVFRYFPTMTHRQVGYQLMEKYPNLPMRCRTLFAYARPLIRVKPFRYGAQLMEDCFDSALEYGDYPFAGYGSHNLVGMQYYSGYPLQQVSIFFIILIKVNIRSRWFTMDVYFI